MQMKITKSKDDPSFHSLVLFIFHLFWDIFTLTKENMSTCSKCFNEHILDSTFKEVGEVNCSLV